MITGKIIQKDDSYPDDRGDEFDSVNVDATVPWHCFMFQAVLLS